MTEPAGSLLAGQACFGWCEMSCEQHLLLLLLLLSRLLALAD